MIVKFTAVYLLDRASREARFVFNQILQPHLGGEAIAEQHRAVPGHVDPGKHRVHPGESANVSAEGAIEREDKRGRGQYPSVLRFLAVGRIAPQGIVVADAVRPVPDAVAGGLVAPRLERVLNRNANQLAQVGEAPFGDYRKSIRGLRHEDSLLFGSRSNASTIRVRALDSQSNSYPAATIRGSQIISRSLREIRDKPKLELPSDWG